MRIFGKGHEDVSRRWDCYGRVADEGSAPEAGGLDVLADARSGSVDDDPVEVRSIVCEHAQARRKVLDKMQEKRNRCRLTALPSTEGDAVRARVEVQLHRDAEDNVSSAGVGLFDPDVRAPVHAAKVVVQTR